jgi:hypothetical protein
MQSFFTGVIITLFTYMCLTCQSATLPVACAQCDAKGTDLHANSEIGKQPRIFCEDPTFDFGSRDASETVDHTFVLKNTGTADLEIRRVQPACGCTTAELEKKVVPPGESSRISAKLSLAGRGGELQKPILIESNDPTNPALQLVMKGVVGADFEIAPSTMVLRKDSLEAPVTASIIVRSLKNEKFEIFDAKSESGKLKLRWDKFPNENAFQLTANFEEQFQPGQYGDKIIVETNHPTQKQLEIGVIVIVPSQIVVAPMKIVLDSKSQAPVSRTIILKNPSKDSLAIDKIETHDPSITTKTQTMGDFGLKLTLGNIIPSPSLIGQSVRILFASGQEVRIPFELKER